MLIVGEGEDVLRAGGWGGCIERARLNLMLEGRGRVDSGRGRGRVESRRMGGVY